MKKVFLSALIIIFFAQVISAQAEDSLINKSPQALHDFYIQKRNTNRTWGWITLSSGVIMLASGTAIAYEHLFDEGNQGAGLALAGIVSTLVSIPLFISAGKNKRKAKLALSGGKIGFGNDYNSSNYLSISFVTKLNTRKN